MMNITIVGTGYVGLVSGTCFAEMGNIVTCVDIDAEKVDRLQSGELPIFEPGLERYFERNTSEERLTFTTEIASAVPDSDIVFLALPTPSGIEGQADLSAVEAVADRLGGLIDDYTVVVNKSTVPVGTADEVRETIAARGLVPGEDFDVVSNPEFLREGVAVDDFMKPERVVIGTSSDRAAQLMRDLYEPFVRSGNPILVMEERSAELTKYAANAMLATRITFMNEMANVCERVGANVEKVRHGIGTDSRIGKQFLYAGIGFGGSCFPKDVKALNYTAAEHDYDFQLLDAVSRINDYQRELLAHRVIDYFGGDVEGRRIAVWGLAFKANTDDVREAPSHIIIEKLLEAGAEVIAYDPEAIETTRAKLGDRIEYAHDEYSVLDGAEALVICTEWHEFRRPEFERVRELLEQPVIFDGRNLFELEKMADEGFDYFSIGRPQEGEANEAVVEYLSENGAAVSE
jgi:UDPglucose 6-dehydrogenase